MANLPPELRTAVIIIGGIIIGVVVIFTALSIVDKRQRRAWREAASRLGLRYADLGDIELFKRSGFELFTRHDNPSILYQVSGNLGLTHIVSGRLHSLASPTAGPGVESVVLLESAGLDLPHFKFNRTGIVEGAEGLGETGRQSAEAWLTEKATLFDSGFTIEGRGAYILLRAEQYELNPDTIPGILEALGGLAGSLSS